MQRGGPEPLRGLVLLVVRVDLEKVSGQRVCRLVDHLLARLDSGFWCVRSEDEAIVPAGKVRQEFASDRCGDGRSARSFGIFRPLPRLRLDNIRMLFEHHCEGCIPVRLQLRLDRNTNWNDPAVVAWWQAH